MKKSLRHQGRSTGWSFVACSLALGLGAAVAFAACSSGKPSYNVEQPCETNADCGAGQTCRDISVSSDDPADTPNRVCGCLVGQNGATCSVDSDCTSAGGTCDIASCSCSGGTTTGGGPRPGLAECTIGCTVEDGCPAGDEDSCIDGECVNTCSTTGCSNADFACMKVGGRDRCTVPCMIDGDCFSGKCVGVDDNGAAYCADPCTSDADCDAYSGTRCLEGRCGCEADSDCVDPDDPTGTGYKCDN